MGRVGFLTALAAALALLAVFADRASAQLTQPGTITLPAWSPDGREIAWIDATFDNAPSPPAWEGWEANIDGSRPREIINGPSLSAGAWQLDWLTPRTLAFFGNFSIDVEQLGEKPRLVAANVTDEFSSDAAGDRFAYEKSPCGGQCNAASQVVVIDRRTGTRSIIGGDSTHYTDPTISPDGSHVAFGSPEGLQVARTDGTGIEHLAPPSAACPQWSPDGRRIAYVGAGGSLRVVAASGGTRRVLVPKGVGCGFAPLKFGWSPNGKTIALLASGTRGALMLIDVASGHAQTLTGFSKVTDFAWSPDSAQLLIAAGPAHLHVHHFGGSTATVPTGS